MSSNHSLLMSKELIFLVHNAFRYAVDDMQLCVYELSKEKEPWVQDASISYVLILNMLYNEINIYSYERCSIVGYTVLLNLSSEGCTDPIKHSVAIK